jgi:rhodanese-related sulfurtransferase
MQQRNNHFTPAADPPTLLSIATSSGSDMTTVLADIQDDVLLEKAIRDARASGLPFAGSVPPTEAWALVESGRAVLVDVRSGEERKFVGYVPGSLHVAWATGTSLTRTPRVLRELEAKVGKSDVILFLCRSGKRSALAAEAATKIGFTAAFNVSEGFEGDLDGAGQRGRLGGWRLHGLKWVQD